MRKRGSMWLWMAASVIGLATGTRAPAAIISQGPGLGVTADWEGVGQVLQTLAGNTFISGTGTLVNSTHIITAAHLFYGANPAATFSFKIGSDVYPLTPTINSNYAGNEDFDIAVGTLASPATGHTTYAWNNALIANETTAGTANIVGFGVGGSAATGADETTYPKGTKRQAQNMIDLVTSGPGTTHVSDSNGNSADLPAGLLVWDFDSGTAGNNRLSSFGSSATPIAGGQEGDTTAGDSGGPIFQWSGSQWVVTGIITSGTDPLSRYGDVAWGTQVSAYAQFLGANAPEPTVLGPVLVGLAILARRSKRA